MESLIMEVGRASRPPMLAGLPPGKMPGLPVEVDDVPNADGRQGCPPHQRKAYVGEGLVPWRGAALFSRSEAVECFTV